MGGIIKFINNIKNIRFADDWLGLYIIVKVFLHEHWKEILCFLFALTITTYLYKFIKKPKT